VAAFPSVSTPSEAASATAPRRAGLVLISLIFVAAVANLNLTMANVALPSIAKAFDSPDGAQPDRGRVLPRARRVVLYYGALGDRYGRKLMQTPKP
jgi:DHA2 family multidrug resistance protein-like MFS transporter